MKKRIIAVISALMVTVTALPAVTYAENNEPKPALHYTFDGKNPLADENGKNVLKLTGGASVTEDGNTGKGLLLDGADGYALLPKNILSDSMTITAWVKLNKLTTWGRVFDFGTDADNNFFFAPYSGGASRVEMKSPAGVDTMDCAQETERDWVHYAVTVDNGTVSYYRNGRLIKSKSGVQSLSNIKNELNYIGKSHYDGDAYLSAVVDDFRVYNSALDRDTICDIVADGEINPEIMLDSYAIEDGQIITGDKIELPKLGAMTWTESDNLGLIDTATGVVKHNAKTEAVTLTAWIGEETRDYTVYVTGTDENPYTINIDVSDRSKKISDTMWGLFFEDINSSADGGLYAEMVQNRSFEMDDHLYSWKTSGDVKVGTENPLNENNPTYVTLDNSKTISLIVNDGFQGMSIKKGEKYIFTAYVRGKGHPKAYFIADDRVQHMDLDYDDTERTSDNTIVNKWHKVSYELIPRVDSSNAKLAIMNASNDNLDIDMVSLIPEDTYKGHGLRRDLMEQLEAMHPSFLRFPGGCAVEGQTMDKAWNWKDTIGDVSERKEMINIWDGDGTYKMTYGLGFYEYFQMCEDLGMEPVPILNCGMACQVRSGSAEDAEHLVPMDKLQPYIDDALDLIAFANGMDETNEWTKKRIEMGHKEPFNMKYIGIGNEQYGEIYFERYAEFAKQIHEKYPDINLVTTSGTASSGTGNDLAWNWANENQELADFMDEHYYENPDWFRTHAYRYDNYRRDINTKVFLGEYASKGNTWYNALSEAAFMTGLERNADVVRMASYAPMFAKYGNVQWSAANMIWFNNDDYVLTPNYYVQSLFSNNRGDYSLQTDVKMNGIEKDDTLHGGALVGSWGTHNEFKDFVITSSEKQEVTQRSFEAGAGEWNVRDDGVIEQTGDATGSVFMINSDDLSNYTFSLKAKKTAGAEGFQIGVAAEDGHNYYRVNIGGWGNTTAKVQRIVNGVSAETGNVAEQSYVGNVHIEDNKWYDVRVEVSDYEIKAYLNGEFICSYVKPKEYGPVYASSVYDEENGKVIVKLVNTMDSDVDLDLNFKGIKTSAIDAVSMSGDTSLENSLDNKYAIAPLDSNMDYGEPRDSLTYTAKANSFNVLKISVDEQSNESVGYISGYTDGTFRPDNTITRAEVSAIVAQNIDSFDNNETYANNFSDVSDDEWYSNYINFMYEKNRIHGYPDGTFKPENPITRAEFAVIVCNHIADPPAFDSYFPDVPNGNYASGFIGAIALRNIISGYPDGTFKPDNYVTRAEAVTMINKVLGRGADSVQTAENPFKDVSPSHWAYNEIMKAVQ